MPAARSVLRRRALRLLQTADHPLYVFSLTAAELASVADISRVSRDDAGKLLGYQRPEVKRHVNDIVSYLNGDAVLFPNPPAHSRLTHGAGLRAMGRLMDRVMAGINPRDPKAAAAVEREVRLVAPLCRWTGGEWEGLNGLPWNELQNTPRHIRLLSNHLIRAYTQAKGTGG